MMEWFSVTLRCHHPNWDPNDISAQLGMTPDVRWKAGEERRTPKGQVLDGQNKSSYWCSPELGGSWDDPPKALMDHLEMLESNRAFIEGFVATGGRIELFLGWGLLGPSGGQLLDAVLLRRLGELHVDLSIDVYAQELKKVTV
jgi:hypothetical protein